MFFFRNKVIGVALCSVSVGMVIITILPRGSLGLILACILFIVGFFLIKQCYY